MDANDPARRSLARRVTSALAWLLLTLWGVWWALAVWWGALPGASVTWIPALPVLAADFQSIDHVARLFVAGHEPTRLTGDWVCMLYPYPPVVNRAFGWVALVSTSTATRLWLAALSAIYVGGAVAAWKARGALRLPTLPLAAIVAALVYSSPALLAMEGGRSTPWWCRPSGWRPGSCGGRRGAASCSPARCSVCRPG